jgi:hypothetical protein
MLLFCYLQDAARTGTWCRTIQTECAYSTTAADGEEQPLNTSIKLHVTCPPPPSPSPGVCKPLYPAASDAATLLVTRRRFTCFRCYLMEAQRVMRQKPSFGLILWISRWRLRPEQVRVPLLVRMCLRVCVRVCLFVCGCVFIVRVHFRVRICICAHACSFLSAPVCAIATVSCPCICVCVCVCVRALARLHAHVYAWVCARA